MNARSDYSEWSAATAMGASFWCHMKHAIQEGILLGVKWAIVAAVIVIALSFVVNDYGLVRQRAKNGQWAAEVLQQRLAAEQQAKGPKVSPP